MSVIVLGMEMPKQGWKCPLNGGGVCKLESLSCGKYIPALCPLHPLPEKHGRLIDAVELWNQLEEMRSEERERNGEKSVYYVMASMAMAMVAAQDTIVEAEGE